MWSFRKDEHNHNGVASFVFLNGLNNVYHRVKRLHVWILWSEIINDDLMKWFAFFSRLIAIFGEIYLLHDLIFSVFFEMYCFLTRKFTADNEVICIVLSALLLLHLHCFTCELRFIFYLSSICVYFCFSCTNNYEAL